MNSPRSDLSATAVRRETKAKAALGAAYREGLGLTALAVMGGPAGPRIAVGENPGATCLLAPEETLDMLWWCRRAADAAGVAAAATSRWQRRESKDGGLAVMAREALAAMVESAARRRGIALYSDAEISHDAECVIARVNEEIAALQRSGGMRSINQSYRIERINAAARGEKVPPYAEWLNIYKAKLVREIAAALRFI